MKQEEQEKILMSKAMRLLGNRTKQKYGTDHYKKIGEKGRRTQANKRAKKAKVSK